MKIRLIWDDCSPTMERRPATDEDIQEDIHIKEFDNEDDFVQHILDLTNSDMDDLEDAEGSTPFDKAVSLMGYCDDPGDGSPNFLYLSVDGEENTLSTYPYDCLSDLDLEKCSEEEIKKVLIDNNDEDYEDFETYFDNLMDESETYHDELLPQKLRKYLRLRTSLEDYEEDLKHDFEDEVGVKVLGVLECKDGIDDSTGEIEYSFWCDDNKSYFGVGLGVDDDAGYRWYSKDADDIIKELNLNESLNEASSAEKKAFKKGGQSFNDYIQGKAIARIKDPKVKKAAIAAKKADRDDVVKQFTGDRKENQAIDSFEKKENKMAKAGMLGEDVITKMKKLPYGLLAWKLGEIMMSMNNEEAYYGGWLYIWPDGETKEECMVDFGDKESYDELRKSFEKYYKRYHDDGLYTEDDDIVDYAHKIDAKLGLKPIENYYKKIEDDSNQGDDPYDESLKKENNTKIVEDLESDLLGDLIYINKEDLDEGCEDIPEWEQRKNKILEYYTQVKEWATDPKAKTSCRCNIGIDTLNEWLGEDNND